MISLTEARFILGEVKRIWGKKLPLTAAGVQSVRAE
jgi:hypothetical protein